MAPQPPVLHAPRVRNCGFKAEVNINHGGNCGMYFRAKFGPEWPDGYEAQVNNTHSDWRRTGSLYRFADIKEQLIPDDTWWTQDVIASGNHIIIKVNDKVVVDYVDAEEYLSARACWRCSSTIRAAWWSSGI